MGRPAIDITDHKFGMLTALRRGTKTTDGRGWNWWCQCSCGSDEKEFRLSRLRSGGVKSCGCMRIKMLKAHFELKRRMRE